MVKIKSTSAPRAKFPDFSSKNKRVEEMEKGNEHFASKSNQRKSFGQDEKFSNKIISDILDKINDGLIFLSPNGIILDLNRKAAEFFGSHKEELLGKHFTKIGIFTARDSSWLLRNFKAALSQKVNLIEVKIRNKKGKELYLECSVNMIKKGRFLSGFIIIARDITQHKLAEMSLKNSEERLKILFDYAPDAYYLNDLKGNFIDGNKKAEELTGYKREELIGKNFLKLKLLSLPQIPKAAAALAKNALGQPTGPDEFTLKRKDGRQVTLEISTYPVKIKDQSLVLGIARDITDKKRKEEALKQSKVRFHQFFENSPEYCYMISPEGNIIDINKTALKTLGYKKEELIGRPLKTIYAPESQEEGEIYFEEWKKTGKLRNKELVIMSKEGKRRTVLLSVDTVKDKNGQLVHSVSIQRDITERMKAQEERILLTSAIEQAEEIIAITDVDYQIEYVNPALKRITGFTQEEVRGQSFRLFLKNGNGDFWQKIREALMKGKAWRGRVSLRKKNSKLFEAEITASPVRGSQGSIMHYIFTMRDVTQQVKFEAQLQQVQKMEALGTLTGGIAHDFNNILTSIIGYTELALDDAPPGSLLRSNLEEVFRAGKRGQELVNQILTFSRPSSQEKKPVQASLLIKEALRLLRVSLAPNIKIHQKIKSDSMVMADPTQIHQVIINLCKNAAYALSAA
ncbi:MAG: PAS domain S-box protein, partial [Candidatus Aminicenantales bacterium]